VSERARAAVERGYEAWNSGDVEALLETLHPDIVWEPSGAFPGIGDRYEGHAGVREFWRDFTAPWEWVRVQLTESRDLGEDDLLVRARFHGRGRAGIEVEQEFGQRYEIRGELLYRMHSYGSWDEALAATGAGDS